VSWPVKDLGNCDVYPQALSHDASGRLVCVCGDGEYIIYTALSLKNKSFGSALEFQWGQGKGVYATRESSSRVKVFKDFQEASQLRLTFAAEGIYGGPLLAVRSADFVDFYDWEVGSIISHFLIVMFTFANNFHVR
jgi:coatomer subunit beta'